MEKKNKTREKQNWKEGEEDELEEEAKKMDGGRRYGITI